MAATYRRRPRAALEDAVRRAYADRAAAGLPRPTVDELHEAAGHRQGAPT